MTEPSTTPFPDSPSPESVRLYRRTAKLTVFRDGKDFTTENPTGIEITDLRFKFEVQRSLTSTPNTADVWIHNLAPRTRAELEGKNLTVQLEAGYDNVNRLLCVGNVHFAMSEEQHTDWVTLLQLTDNGRGITFGRTNKSYGPGTTVRKVIQDVAATMGLNLPSNLVNDSALDRRLPTGIVAAGPSSLELTRLLAPFGYHWSVQNGRLVVLRDEEHMGGEALLIDEGHGMIGTPQFGSPSRRGAPAHVNIKTLLYPEVEPGALVRVRSRSLGGGQGDFKVDKVKHTGDTHGATTWVTEAQVVPV